MGGGENNEVSEEFVGLDRRNKMDFYALDDKEAISIFLFSHLKPVQDDL